MFIDLIGLPKGFKLCRGSRYPMERRTVVATEYDLVNGGESPP